MNAPIKIVHVEDDDLFTMFLRDLFEEHGIDCTLESITDGEAALTAIKEMFAAGDDGFPDAILIDLRVPRLHGYEVIRRANELGMPIQERTKVMVLTGSLAVEDQDRSAEIGVAGFYSKDRLGDLMDALKGLARA